MAHSILFIPLIIFWCIPGGHFETMTYTSKKQSDSSIDPTKMMRQAKVVLHPPKNLTFFLVTSSEAVIGWLPPNVYTSHNVNTTLIDPLFNSTMVWLNHTYPQIQTESPNSATQPDPQPNQTETPAEISNSAHDDDSKAPFTPSNRREKACQSLEFFANYTVGVNVSEEALKDYLPHLITLKEMFIPQNVTADVINKDIVPFAQGCVREYRVFYHDNKTENASVVVVKASERPEVHLKSLQSGTTYSIYVTAVFFSNTSLHSATAHFTTASVPDPTKAILCECDWDGTNMKDRVCKRNLTQPCDCREGYQGRFCELCAPGYYRTAPYFPCHRCPCANHATRDNSCYFREGFLTCSQCEVGYTGNICHMCAYGYYRHHRFCVPCNCNTNHNTSRPFMCDVITGACHCSYNTSGMNCELCRTGYSGDALHLKNCAPEGSGQGVFQVLSQGMIAAICVGVVLLLSFLVGCVIYWRMSKNPPKRPFWTVELKDDHEGVNFNTVPNDDFQIVDPKMTMDDMEFYEKQGGSAQSRGGGSAGQKYARLQENV
ncbi:hypothetical protein ACOMHN_049772 [Nucella lapillus]